MHRVLARMGHGVADAAAGFAVLLQDAPDRVRQEWDLFQEEVKAEAERLDRENGGVDAQSSPASSVGEESLIAKTVDGAWMRSPPLRHLLVRKACRPRSTSCDLGLLN